MIEAPRSAIQFHVAHLYVVTHEERAGATADPLDRGRTHVIDAVGQLHRPASQTGERHPTTSASSVMASTDTGIALWIAWPVIGQ